MCSPDLRHTGSHSSRSCADRRAGGMQRLRPPARAPPTRKGSAHPQGHALCVQPKPAGPAVSGTCRALRCSSCFPHSRGSEPQVTQGKFMWDQFIKPTTEKEVKSSPVRPRMSNSGACSTAARERMRTRLASRGFLPAARLGGISSRQLLTVLLFKCVRSQGPAQPRNRMFSLNCFNYFNAETSTVNNTKSVPCLRRRVSISLGVRRIEGNSEQLFFFCLGNKTSHT